MPKVVPLGLQRYIRLVSAQTGPDLRVSKNFLNLTDDTLSVVLNNLIDSAMLIKKTNNREELMAKDFQAAVRVVIGGGLAKHAVAEGTKAVTIYSSDSAGKKKGDKQTRASRAKLVVSVSKVENAIRSMLKKGQRCSSNTFIYATAVVEYLAAEICELSGNAARDNKRKTIVDKDFNTAIQADPELLKFIQCY